MGRLLQLQIQALQVTECGYKNSSSKLFMAKALKWGLLHLFTLIFQYDIHKNALKSQDYYPDCGIEALIKECTPTLMDMPPRDKFTGTL